MEGAVREDLGMRETLDQVMKEEKNVVWLKWNENIWGGNFMDARMNVVNVPNLGSSTHHTNQCLLNTCATGVILGTQAMSLQASLTLRSYK